MDATPPAGVRYVAKNMRVDLRLIAEMIASGTRVLDIGCGDGTLIDHLYRTNHILAGMSRLYRIGKIDRLLPHGPFRERRHVASQYDDLTCRVFDFDGPASGAGGSHLLGRGRGLVTENDHRNQARVQLGDLPGQRLGSNCLRFRIDDLDRMLTVGNVTREEAAP